MQFPLRPRIRRKKIGKEDNVQKETKLKVSNLEKQDLRLFLGDILGGNAEIYNPTRF
jgi:hypothetical protein